MSLGGLGLKIAAMKLQKPKQKCERCGLYYDRSAQTCTYCAHMSDAQLSEFLATIESHQQANTGLGKFFFILMLVLLAGMLLIVAL